MKPTAMAVCLFAAACGGAPVIVIETEPKAASDAGDDTAGGATGDAAPEATDDASTVLEDAKNDSKPPSPTLDGAGDPPELVDAPADAGDVFHVDTGGPRDASDFDAAECDPAFGDASPGGPCCVHVWATPTVGAVLCTVDGTRWCWQTGMPCSDPGSKCVYQPQSGITYCAP